MRPGTKLPAGSDAAVRHERWLLPWRTPDDADVTLACIPYAGGSSAAFRAWAGHFPRRVATLGVELPGRGRRVRELPMRRMEPLVTQLVDALVREVDTALALFGHSFGAAIAWETAQALRARGAPEPIFLAVSGCAPPTVWHKRSRRRLHVLPDDELLDTILGLGGTPRKVAGDRSLMREFLRALRSDLEVLETRCVRLRDPLDCPMLVLGGDNDPLVAPRLIEGWRRCTRGPVRVEILPGGHFFLHERAACTRNHVVRGLREAVVWARRPRMPAVGGVSTMRSLVRNGDEGHLEG